MGHYNLGNCAYNDAIHNIKMSIVNCKDCSQPIDTDLEDVFDSNGKEVCESCWDMEWLGREDELGWE